MTNYVGMRGLKQPQEKLGVAREGVNERDEWLIQA